MNQSDPSTAFVPPSDIAAEQSILGAALTEARAIDAARSAGMTAADFYRPGHALLWGVIEDMAAQSRNVDFVTVQHELQKRGTDALEQIGGLTYLLTLMDTVPTAANAAHYASIVVHHAVRRRVCEAGLDLIAFGQRESDSAQAVTEDAERRVMMISDTRQGGGGGNNERIGPLLCSQYARSEQMYDRGGKMLGLSTGLPGLDRLTSGLQSPDFVVLAARPGAGKTSLLLHMAVHVAINLKQPVVLFSLEMSKNQYADRIACMLAGLDSLRMRMGNLTDEEWGRYSDAVQRCYDAPLLIDDTPGLTTAGMASTLRRFRREAGGLAFAGVDYLQLMSSGQKSENRTQAVSQISRDIKALAMTERIPVMALSQLSRGVESRPNKRPMLSDLRESGQIEADADLVAFLYNESYYARMDNPTLRATEQTVDEVEFIVAKHRNGPTGIVKVGFQPTFTRFADITVRDDAPTGF